MDIISILFVIAIAIVLLMVIREIVCWYSKINERIELQKQTNELLKKLIDKGIL